MLLPQILSSATESNPAAVAVVSAAGSLTYAELDAQSSRLAWVLAGRGIGAEDVVAVSESDVVAFWAVAKTGAAIATDGTEVVSTAALQAEMSAASSESFSYSDRVRSLQAANSVIVTDAVMTHEGLAALPALVEACALTADSRIFAAGVGFLASVLAASAGASIVDEAAQATHVLGSSAGLNDVEPSPSGGSVFLVGDIVEPALVSDWSAAGWSVSSLFAPVAAGWLGTSGAALLPGGPVSLGAALAGVTAQVLDAQLRPVPVDEAGELYLSGPGLARSVGGSASTAVSLIAAPDGSRVLRTGVKVRINRDGLFEPVDGPMPGLVADSPSLLSDFERQVERTPDAVALVAEGQSLTYREFADRVFTLSRHLIDLGVGAEARVGLAMRRGIDLMVGMYATVSAGGAWVPVDPDHPAERIDYILETAQPVCVLTNSADSFATQVAPVVVIDAVDLSGYATSTVTDADRIGALRPENIAYVIFTSGSTGRPKGVAVSHAAVINQMRWMNAEYGLTGADVYLQKTATTFDVSLWGFWMPLMVGAKLVLCSPDGHKDPQYVSAMVAEHQATITDFVPSMLSVFIGAAKREELATLRHVFVIGEALPAATAQDWFGISDAGLHNLYGPTEAAVSVTYWQAGEGDTVAVPIGVPEWNVRCYVLDGRLNPTPAGIPGELYLAGIQVARGYLTRPDLTSDRFVADPFGGDGGRLYRTGDLVRRRADGVIDYIGRTDFQVKLRGQRIELGEIEADMLNDPAVSQAAAIVRDTSAGQQQLVGYVVPVPGSSIDVDALRQLLAEKLPAYMLPEAYVVMDAFPLNTSGKLDRKALPAPEIQAKEFRAPEGRVEETVASVFGHILGIDLVGADDDFFDLGGNSLLATQVAARVGAALDMRIPPRVVFESSSVAELAAAIADHVGEGGHKQLKPQPRPERIPLSLAQSRMWFLNRFDPASAVYNIPLAIRLTGNLDIEALQAAVADVVNRHEVLRTVYPEFDGVPYQDVRPVGGIDVTPIEVSAADVLGKAAEVVTTGFDVTTDVPVRVAFFSIVDAPVSEYVLVVVVHHIAGDGYSVGPLARDLMIAYASRANGQEPGWQPLEVQYADFSIWQRDVLGSEDNPDSLIAQQEKHWLAELAGLPTVLELPADRKRPSIASLQGASYKFELDAATAAALTEIGRVRGASLFMVLHAAFSVLLARLSGTSDIAVGTAVAGRDEEALDHLVGMFVNTLVLRTQVDLSSSFEAIIAEARETDITAFENADVPFERLVEVINPARTQAHSPLFQVGLIFQNMGQSAFEMPDLTVSAVEADVPMSKWDLQLTLGERHALDGTVEGISAEFTYATDLFDESTIVGFADRLSRIIEAVRNDPTVIVGDVELIGADERQLVLETWNATAHEVDRSATLVSMFESQVARTPNATAVVFEGEDVSYAEFSARVNRLARHLRELGVGPESYVAVGMRRSIDMLASIYAIITAGGAYVPVDPDHPAERIDYILETAQPVALLTTTSDGLTSAVAPVIAIDELDLTGVSADPLPLAAAPDNLAYVIFTSGSTGRPKGVGVSHRAIVNRLEWMQGEYRMTAEDAVVQKTPVTFDVSVWELFWPLEIGARLVIAKPDGHRDPEYLAQLIAEHSVTIAHFVPSMMAVFVGSNSAADANSLRMVFASGEALPAQTAQKLRELVPGVRVHNLYGPTEAAVDVTFHEVTDDDTISVPIGAPVWNTGLRVLDARLQPVAVGVPGELYLTGVQLARGYVGRPDLTADRFVADPYAPGRMYRTGDLVHWLGNGEIEYIGRTDFQVKLRGLRIELGEIEAALLAHDDVGQSAALVLDTPTGQRLVGYVVPADGAAPDPAVLQEFLGHRLPEYMVPASILVVDAFPLNPSGKLDRKALPTPPIEATEYRAPTTTAEKLLAEVFSDVLFRDRVGADDDFFSLGGDSITSIKLVARAKSKGVLISPRDVFEQRTVAGLASVAKQALLEELPGGPVGAVDPTPAAALFADRAQSISVEFTPADGDLATAAEAVWKRHDALRSRVGETWEVLAAEEFDPAVFVADSLTTAYDRIDPASGVMVQFGPGFVVAHRLVADALSLGIVADDLTKALRGEPLTGDGTSFRRWARALTDASTTEPVLDELSRWRMNAAFRTAPLGERPVEPTVDLMSTVRTATAAIDNDTAEQLRSTVPATYYCATSDVLVAAVAGALTSWQSTRSVLLGVTADGRNSPHLPGVDVARTVGSFETVYPVAIDLNQVAPDDADALVKLVKERLRSIPGDGLGYGVLRHVNPETAAMFTAGDPDVRVRFGNLIAANPAAPAPALEIAIDTDSGTATFAAPAGVGIDVDALAATFVATAEAIVARAQEPGAGGPTPSDFPLVRIGQPDLDAIIDRYGTVSGIWPLSPLQAGFAFLNLMSGNVADVYTTQVVVDLAGEADACRLHKAAQAVIDRYPNLRAGFTATQTGTPVQVVANTVELPWREVDLSAESDPAAALETLAETDRKTPFDLQTPPLVRFTFVTLADGEFKLVVTNHHILLDGWSTPLLMKDLLVLYATHGNSAVLPDVRPYSDYLEWLTQQDEDAARRRWRDALSGAEPTLLSSGAVATATAEPGFLDFALDEATTIALQAVATKHGVTLNTLFQTAWAVLLGAMNGQRDVVFGATVLGRPAELPGIESMVGLFINTIPVRVELDDAETLSQLLRRVQREQAAMLDVHYLGLADIQAASGLHELFDSLVIFESYPIDQAGLSESAVSIDGMAVTGVDSRGGAHYPLMFEVHPGPQLKFVTGYLPHLLDESAARTIGTRMVSLLETIAYNSDLPLGAVTLINEAERELVVNTWNNTSHPLEPGLLHDRFVSQATKTPDSVALVADGTELTYAEFADRVFRLARHLVSVGVGPEERVGLAMRRGIDLVVGMYATVCAGGAWVPVDPDHPAERIDYILDTAQPVCVLTNSADAFVTDIAPVIVIDAVDLSGYENLPLDVAVRPDNTAYVIFTSGSTGRPKGVAVPHAAIANQQAWMLHEYGFAADDVYVQKTATTFDVSLWGYWLPLMVGARLVLASPDGHRDAGYISSLIAEHRATITDFVPSMLGVFVGAASAADLESLRHVFVIGEALPAATARAWKQLSSAGLHNLYGPTEAAVSVTYWPATGAEAVSVPIGVPEWNVRCYVLDQHLQVCAPGVAGELYLADVQLARGYLTRPDLTSDRFVASPFGTGERMYRTGDLVRWTRDGLLDYIGRTDFQVKLRGQRIELGEIEAAFLGHESVRQAAVLVLDTAIGQQLVAYLVTDAEPSVLREHAAGRLPRYMVPDAVVTLDEFPLNTSGKLDRKALPVPSVEAAEYRAPSTPYEEIVAAAFAGLLGIDRVGADDDFFGLGGNSLLATQLAARISAELDARIPVFAVFEAPTVSELAMRAQSHAGEGGRIALTARTRPDHVPLSLAQSRMWFLNQMDPASPIYNLPLAIRITGPLDTAAMQAAIGDVIARHEVLRTVYPRTADGPSQVVVPAAEALPDLTPVIVTEDDVIPKVAAVLAAGFDVTTAVPLRVALFALDGGNEHVLAVVVHHIAGDGFSMAPLARDVMVAYSARKRGDAPQWQPLPVQYADYTLWQRDVLGSDNDPNSLVSKQIAFWKQQLDGVPESLTLAGSKPRPDVFSFRGANAHFTVPDEVAHALGEIARANGVTPFMVLHAALAVLLAKLSATDDITIGTPIAGRGERELDDMVGMFVNTLVLRTPVDVRESFAGLLKRVRDVDLAAFGHADVPFERLVDALSPARSTAHTPLFQVILSFQSAVNTRFELDDLVLAPVEFDAGMAKFDIQLTIAETVGDDGQLAGLAGEFNYATDLFDASAVEVIVARWNRLLTAIAADPALPVGHLAILEAPERAELVSQIGPGEVTARTLAQILADAVALNPDGEALYFDGLSMTYREADAYTNRLARVLIARGLGPEDRVAVGITRSAHSVLAEWAITKAGAAFVPVDPRYPVDRIAHMVSDSGSTVGLTQQSYLADLPDAVNWIVLDDAETLALIDAESTGPISDAERLRPLRLTNTAYVIYTSGSTGLPKGVLVPHSGLGSFTDAQRDSYGVTPRSRVLHFASPSFDASVLEMTFALSAGATLVIVPTDVYGGADLAEVLAERAVTHVFITPAALASIDPEGLDQLEVLAVGGEAYSPELVRRWGNGRKFFNVYGPTEASMVTNIGEPLAPGDPLTIGQLVRGVRALVLDKTLQPVPVGVPGDLYLAGDQLARGYHDRFGLTAGKFVADPFGPPGGRMYHTGDVVRWTPQWRLDYVGRSDFQVKIRGFRVELGEIDAVFMAHPQVDLAATIAHRADNGLDALVTYVAGGRPDAAQLREFVSSRLAAHMVPASIMVLDEIPLNPSGKLNRAVLPAPVFEAAEFREPQTPTEMAVAEAFAAVLGIERVGADDDFFALGGNSLAAVSARAELTERLGKDIRLQWFFTNPTVHQLAAAIDEAGSDQDGFGVLLPFRTTGELPPLFCVHPAVGLSTMYAALIPYLDGNRPLYGVQTPGLLEADYGPSALGEIAARYVAEIRRVQPSGPYQLLGWSLGGAIAHEMAVQLQAAGESVGSLIILDSRHEISPETIHRQIRDGLAGLGIELAPDEDLGNMSEERAQELFRVLDAAALSLTVDHVRGLFRAALLNVDLLNAFTPSTFDGDAVFVGADGEPDEIVDGEQLWGPVTSGAVTQLRVPQKHDQLLFPEALEVWATHLESWLAAPSS